MGRADTLGRRGRRAVSEPSFGVPVSRRPRAASTALALVAGLLLSACGAGSGADVGGEGGSAATVNGRVIERGPLADDVRAVMAAQPEDSPTPIDEAAVQRQLLTLEILSAILAGEVESRGLEVSEDDLSAVRGPILESLGADEATLEAALVERGLTVAFLDRVYVPYFASANAITRQLAAGRTLDQREARHILVETLAEAEAVVAELEAGADFAELASERSQDPGSAAQGGSLGPQPQGAFVREFDEFVWAAEVGDVSGPILTQFGFHVIELLAIDSRPASELGDDERLALVGAEFQELLVAAIEAASISIAPGLGAWDATLGQVVAEPVVGEDGTP